MRKGVVYGALALILIVVGFAFLYNFQITGNVVSDEGAVRVEGVTARVVDSNGDELPPSFFENILEFFGVGKGDEVAFAPGCAVVTPIARWDIVPYQGLEQGQTMNLGVVAFSMNDIDRVEFSISGSGYSGGVKVANQMSYNSQSGVSEFWVPISSSEFTSNGPVTVTATVYDDGCSQTRVSNGNDGFSQLQMFVFPQGRSRVIAWVATDGNDVTGLVGDSNRPFLTFTAAANAVRTANSNSLDGGIIKVKAGMYTHSNYGGLLVSGNSEWFTVMGDDGTTRDNVIFQAVNGGTSMRIDDGTGSLSRLKLEGIKIQSSQAFASSITLTPGAGSLWYDDVSIQGGGIFTGATPVPTNTGADNKYVTNTHYQDVAFGVTAAQLTRNVTMFNLGDDAFQNNVGPVINVEAFNINSYGAQPDNTHADCYQYWGAGERRDNVILYNYKCMGHYSGFQMTGQVTNGHAIVNVFFEVRPPLYPPQAGPDVISLNGDHLLVRNSMVLLASNQPNTNSDSWGGTISNLEITGTIIWFPNFNFVSSNQFIDSNIFYVDPWNERSISTNTFVGDAQLIGISSSGTPPTGNGYDPNVGKPASASSPAVDKINYYMSSQDLGGNARPFDGKGDGGAEYDIGPYEYGASELGGCTIDAECPDTTCMDYSCQAGSCVGAPQNEGLDCVGDGLFCNGKDMCISGVCGNEAPECPPDAYSCTSECNEAGDFCESTFNHAACNDANVCTTDSCVGAGGASGTGCLFAPNTLSCDDGNECTNGDACSGGACSGTVIPMCVPSFELRLNAGGGAYTDGLGNSWIGDSSYLNPTYTTGTFSTGSAIAGTTDDVLYQTERYAPNAPYNMEYLIPVTNGEYNVTLHYAEITFTAANQRIFDVTIEGTKVLDNFDVYAAAGGRNVAITRSFVVNVNDGVLNIYGQADPTDGSKDTVKFSAIEIKAVGGAATFQCSDGIDNDGDGSIDYPADFGCVSSSQDTELNTGTTQCSDGIDNDGDLSIDQSDVDCENRDDINETFAGTISGDVEMNGIKPIARWDVVPRQRINAGQTMNLGVVAFHKDGIKNVKFRVTGPGVTTNLPAGPNCLGIINNVTLYPQISSTVMGNEIIVDEMTLNSQLAWDGGGGVEWPGVWEYWFPLPAGCFSGDGQITVSAEVTGTDDSVRTGFDGAIDGDGLDNLILIANPAGGSLTTNTVTINPGQSIRDALRSVGDGGIVYMNAGTYSIDIPLSSEGDVTTVNEWVTLTRAPGLNREDVIINGITGKPLYSNYLKIQGITMNVSSMTDENVGFFSQNSTDFRQHAIWFDDVDIIGPYGTPLERGLNRQTHPLGKNWRGPTYFTNSITRGVVRGQSGGGDIGKNLFRNMKFEDLIEDVFQVAPFSVNIYVDGMDPGTDAQTNTNPEHADVISGNIHHNFIHYNMYAKDLHYQGMFYRSESLTEPSLNNAYVNIFLDIREPVRTGGGFSQMGNGYRHILYWHISQLLPAQASGVDPYFGIVENPATGTQQQASAVGNYFEEIRTANDIPSRAGNRFEDNHFESVGGASNGNYGDYSGGDPMIETTLSSHEFGKPLAGSPLLDGVETSVVPADVWGMPRGSISDIGAVEANTGPVDECDSVSDCNDGNVCTTDVCNNPLTETSTCSYSNNANSCEDGLACTESGVCSGGVCMGGSPNNALCSNPNSCGTSVCFPPGDFEGCVYSDCPCEASTVDSFQTFPLAAQTGVFVAEFDFTPNGLNNGSVVALSDGQVTVPVPGSFGSYSMLIRLDQTGDIQIRNGTSYTGTSVFYSEGVPYHVKMIGNISSQKYAVNISQGNTQLYFRSGFNFRASATKIDYWGLYGNTGGELTVCNFVINPVISPSLYHPADTDQNNNVNNTELINYLQVQLARTTGELKGNYGLHPKYTNETGKFWVTKNITNESNDPHPWTQGFFPGQLWYMYQHTGNPQWRTWAEGWTQSIAPEATATDNSDLGFLFYPSFVKAYEATGNVFYRDTAITAAHSLAGRYNPNIQGIELTPWNVNWDTPIGIDMIAGMNLLYWAAKETGNQSMSDIADTHVRTVARDFVRPDGSTYQIVNYTSSGTINNKINWQGYGTDNTWARGQAWAMQGFTIAYRETGDPYFLAMAENVSDYFVNHLPDDNITHWDFYFSGLPSGNYDKDSSGSAIAASSLYELSKLTSNVTKAAIYMNLSKSMIEALSKREYLADNSRTNGTLLKSIGGNTGALSGFFEFNVSHSYTDYYFTEAVDRWAEDYEPALCGNAVLESNEQCDGTNFALASNECSDYLGPSYSGNLGCGTCIVDSSPCVLAGGSTIPLSACGILDQDGATYLLTQNLSAPSASGSVCLNITASNIVLDGGNNKINGSGITTSRAILSVNQKNLTITNLLVSTVGTGIQFYGVNDSNITLNIFYNTTRPLQFFDSSNFSVTNSIFNISSSGSSFTCPAGRADKVVFENNIYLSLQNGIDFQCPGNGILIKNNTLISNQFSGIIIFPPVGAGIRDLSILNNTMSGNEIAITVDSGRAPIINSDLSGVVQGSTDVGIYLRGSNFSNFTLRNVFSTGNANQDLLVNNGVVNVTFVDTVAYKYAFNNNLLTFEKSQWGKVRFLDRMSGSGANLSKDISIEFNSAFVNSSAKPGLNKSAEISLYGLSGLGLSNPAILREDIECNQLTNPRCYNLTSLNSNNVKFNVSSWTEYSIGNGVETLDPTLLLWYKSDDSPADGVDDSSLYNNDGSSPAVSRPTHVNALNAPTSAYMFDGVNDYVTVGAPVMTTNTVTYGGWIRWNHFDVIQFVGDTIYDVIIDQEIAGNEGYQLYGVSYFISGPIFGSTSNEIRCQSSTAESVFAYHLPADGEWLHVMCRFNETHMDIFINGLLNQSLASGQPSVALPPAGPFIVGGAAVPTVNDYYFNGTTDDIRVYNRSLSDAEIWDIYNEGLPTGTCTINSDCDYLDSNYCFGDSIRHDEGVCISNSCQVQVSTIQDCNNLESDYCAGTDVVRDDYICSAASCTVGSTNLVQTCNNGQFCDGSESCSAGACQSGTPPNQNDGIPCTADSCNEATDTIVHTPNNGLCDNGAWCDGSETCSATLGCQAGTAQCTNPFTCNEGGDTCELLPGACVNDGDCNDGQFCTGVETCVGNVCQAGTPPMLSDGVGCTVDSCNEGTDTIDHLPSNGLCNDGAFCNGEEVCHQTLNCQPGTPPTVSDGVGCTDDSCDEINNAIMHSPNNGLCDNGAWCDGSETCSATLGCQAGTAQCTNPFTCNEGGDTCELLPGACVNDGDCNDGQFCTGVETCVGNVCQAGTPPNQNDGVICTIDSCNEATDAIDHLPSNALCDNGAWCDGSETCSATLGCQVGVAPNQNDGIACTTDSCNEATDTIVHTPNNAACDNGAWCDGSETCSATLGCQVGVAPNCVDTVSCTIDSCDESLDSCVHVQDNAFCNNGLFCDGTEVCDSALDCQPGIFPIVDDGVTCTDDSCDEVNDVVINSPNHTMCTPDICVPGSGTADGCSSLCGNGFIDSGEQCDGSIPFGLTCEGLDYPAGGVLACAVCSIDLSGCSLLPKYDKFDGDTTNFSNTLLVPNINSVSNAVLEISTAGKISFTGQTINFTRMDLDRYVFIKDKLIEINLSGNRISRLDVPAELSFYNVSFVAPKILRDGFECIAPACNITLYNTTLHALVAEILGFSNYTIVEGASCGDSMCTNGESCGSCSTDCGSCRSTGSSGSKKQCNDDRDNDGDGLIDFPLDPGCINLYDNNETHVQSFSGLPLGLCVETWYCVEGPCIDGNKTNTCHDVNNCGTFLRRPASVLGCETEFAQPQAPEKKMRLDILLALIITLIALAVLIIALIIWYRRKKRMERKRAEVIQSTKEKGLRRYVGDDENSVQ